MPRCRLKMHMFGVNLVQRRGLNARAGNGLQDIKKKWILIFPTKTKNRLLYDISLMLRTPHVGLIFLKLEVKWSPLIFPLV